MDNVLETFIKIYKIIIYEEFLVFFCSTLLFLYSIFVSQYSKNKNFFKKINFFFLPLFIIFFSYSFLPDFFSTIGQDSLLELKNPDFGEIIFYIKTFLISLFDPEIFKRKRFWLILFSSFSSALIFFLILKKLIKLKKLKVDFINRAASLIFFLGLIIISYQVYDLSKTFYNLGKSLSIAENHIKNNINKILPSRKNNEDLTVITYIGESTSSLHMSLYGYPFETTSWLKKQLQNKNFIRFTKVYSEYTHTVNSLLSALSFCLKNCDRIDSENYENLVSLVDVINKNNIDTYLFSTQGGTGTSNFASRAVLRAQELQYAYSDEKKDKLKGRRFVPQVKDDEYFFNTFCKKKNIFKNNNQSLVFLHSYAGHGSFGGYKSLIPKNFNIKYPKYINAKNFLGKDYKNFNLTREYDSVISYIDYSISKTAECAFINSKENSKPLIFIYFSDHGESPTSGKGHDSSRVTYEMINVPFVVYFNEIAYKKYIDKFEYIQKLSNENLSLKFFSEIILYLFEIDINLKDNNKNFYSWENFPKIQTDYIIKRRLLDGSLSRINTYWHKKSISEKELSNNNFMLEDTSVRLWQLNNYLKINNLSDAKNIHNLVCQHRANSFILQYKTSLSTGCFETDIIFDKDNVISAHSKALDTNLVFDKFLNSNYQKNTVWIDAKNINATNNCLIALDWLKKYHTQFKSILLELPTTSIKSIKDEKWLDCIDKVKVIDNVEVAYYVDTLLSRKCSSDIKSKNPTSKNCENLYKSIDIISSSISLKSLTFDYDAAFISIDNKKDLKNFKWHIWNIDNPQIFSEIVKKDNIGIILLKNSKNLSNLN